VQLMRDSASGSIGRRGSSDGTAVALMKKVVTNLSEDDIISIAAYLGSLPPQ